METVPPITSGDLVNSTMLDQCHRAHLMALAKEDPNPERVFHIGFLALSRSRKKKKSASHAP